MIYLVTLTGKMEQRGENNMAGFRGGAAVFLTAALIGGIFALGFAAGGCSGGNVFVVNGEGVPRSEYRRAVERLLSLAEKNNPKELEGEKGDKFRSDTERQVATEIIRARLMRQQAAALGVPVPSAEARRRLEEQRAKAGADAFAKDLKRQGLTEQEYLGKLEEQTLVDELGARVSADVGATWDEAESFYLTHKELFSSSAMVHLAHILLDTEGEAKMVADEVSRGADFTSVAKSMSTDEATRGGGGDMGWIEKGTMEPAFEQAAFSLKSGQTSGVIEASDGYHVVKVLERREPSTHPYDEVKKEAMEALLNRKKEERFTDWLRTVFANAQVKVPSGIGRWDPRLGTVVR